jgi:integrase
VVFPERIDALHARSEPARVRALLTRFHAAQAPAGAIPHGVRAAWDGLIGLVAAAEGFADRGALVAMGASRALYILRARAMVAPHALDDAEIGRIVADLPATKRKTLRRAVRRLNLLRDLGARIPALAGALPRVALAAPVWADRAPRVLWADLPDALRADCDRAIARALETAADQAAGARARIAAGEDRALVLAAFETARTRRLGNRAAAQAGYRTTIAWALRTAQAHDLPRDSLAALLARATIERAVDDHVARAAASPHLKDARKSQTLHNRLTVLTTLARYGLRDTALTEDIRLLARARGEVVNAPRKVGMTDERLAFLKMITRSPQVAVALVNAPARIAAAAEERLARAEAGGRPAAIHSALRLYASAVLWAIQMSRPVRSGNLIKARVSATSGPLDRLVWIRDRAHAELRFGRGEVKNGREIIVTFTGDDARILWRWHRELRARYMTLGGVGHSDYLIPGKAAPRLLKDAITLPSGTVSPSTLGEIWDAGADVVGVSMVPHMARHAVATLILARKPGDYSFAAAVLGDTEDTVRRHYAHEEGQHAAAAARRALLAAHPDLVGTLKRSAA